jgi:hypothetical protein
MIRKEYNRPHIEKIELDFSISLQMQSTTTPPTNPDPRDPPQGSSQKSQPFASPFASPFDS